ncbi:hypothetical protein [Pyramidobacter piscolens]|uniref:hypothetical protein n=1 Tax=Pyramidobacter piscolens TaxID=638849 RepID=UPI002AB29497|nr:hypothetical protein [Pyramidobacter piscolens]
MDAIWRALRQAQMAVYVVLCMACAVFGTRLKWMTHDTSSEEYDRRKYVAGIWLAVGAGLVIGLIGHGVHVNSSLLMGISIIAGYAGGRRFLDWILSLTKKHVENLDAGDIAKKVFDKVSKDDKN